MQSNISKAKYYKNNIRKLNLNKKLEIKMRAAENMLSR